MCLHDHTTQRPSVIERTLRNSGDAWDGKSHIFDLCSRGASRANFLEFIIVLPFEVIGTGNRPCALLRHRFTGGASLLPDQPRCYHWRRQGRWSGDRLAEPLLTCIVSGRYEGAALEEPAAAMYEKRQAQAPLVFGGDIETSVDRSKAFPLLAISSQRRLTARQSGSLLRQSLALNVTRSRSSMPQSPLATRVLGCGGQLRRCDLVPDRGPLGTARQGVSARTQLAADTSPRRQPRWLYHSTLLSGTP